MLQDAQITLKPWFMAIRPKTLTAAVIPILAASYLAYASGYRINWVISLSALLGAIFIQIGTNLINDALDFKKGADTHERLGPMRVTQSGLLPMRKIFAGGIGAFIMALLFCIPLFIQGGFPIVVILLVSVLCGYLYTGGPFPLAYVGLGDIFVLIFFGIVSTVTVFYLQTGFIDGKAFLAGVQIGLLSTVLIAINNLRDYKQDEKAFKRTLAVRFGKKFGRVEIAVLCLLPFVLNIFWWWMGFRYTALLTSVLLPLALKIVKYVRITEPGVLYNKFLGMAALLHLLFGIMMSLGFFLKTIQ